MKIIIVSFFFLFTSISWGQAEPFQIYNSKGRKVSFKKMTRKLLKKEIILFGELHNDPMAHFLQLKFAKELFKNGSLSIGAEMLESDNQKYLNNYLKGELTAEGFDSLARLWNNYESDYKPIVDFAKDNRIPFIATNIPRRYASAVYKGGFEALKDLSEEEKSYIATLPIPYDPTLPGYQKMLEMVDGHAGENFPKAQAIKDATMAFFIYEHFKENNHHFLHLNGAYHSENKEGIYWYLHQLDLRLHIGTITTVIQEDINELEEEHKGLADFIIVVDKDVPRNGG